MYTIVLCHYYLNTMGMTHRKITPTCFNDSIIYLLINGLLRV